MAVGEWDGTVAALAAGRLERVRRAYPGRRTVRVAWPGGEALEITGVDGSPRALRALRRALSDREPWDPEERGRWAALLRAVRGPLRARVEAAAEAERRAVEARVERGERCGCAACAHGRCLPERTGGVARELADLLRALMHSGAALTPAAGGGLALSPGRCPHYEDVVGPLRTCFRDRPLGKALYTALRLAPATPAVPGAAGSGSEARAAGPLEEGVPSPRGVRRTVEGALDALLSLPDLRGPGDDGYAYAIGGEEELARACEAARRAGVAGLDTETMAAAAPWRADAALDPYLGRVRLVQLAVPSDDGRVRVTVADVAGRVPDCLFDLLADERIVKVGHNLKFDLKMIWGTAGRASPARNLFDTMLAAQLADSGLWHPSGYSLSALSHRVLGLAVDKTEQTSDWSRDLTESQMRYAARDAAVLLLLACRIARVLRDAGLEHAAEIEMDALPAVARMELAGIGFDAEHWRALTDTVTTMRDRARDRLLSLLPRRASPQVDLLGGDPLNPDSPAQVLAALRELGVDVRDTRDDTLLPLAERHPAVAALLEYRRHAKRVSAFLEPIPHHVHPVTGRIHANYQQLNRNGVGRFSCSDPNIQQIPREDEYRRAFVPTLGNALVIADYSAIEMRIMAKLSGDEGLMRVFQEGADPHRRTAALILGKPEAEVTKQERQTAKACGFGLIYGMGAEGLRRYAKASYGVDMSSEEARRFRAAFFRAYPGVAAYHRRQDTVARSERAARTLSGRMRRWATGDMPLTELANTPDQGTGADILKRAMGRLDPLLMRMGAVIVACVHDELVVECPVDRADEVREVVVREMAAAGEEFLAPVPVEVEAVVGWSWADKG